MFFSGNTAASWVDQSFKGSNDAIATQSNEVPAVYKTVIVAISVQ